MSAITPMERIRRRADIFYLGFMPRLGAAAPERTMVGAIGFEPTTSWSQTRRSTRLSYTPLTAGMGRVGVAGVNDGFPILERKPRGASGQGLRKI